VEALTDLAGKRVCTIATSTSATALEAAGIKRPKLALKINDCITDLIRGEYDAVTTDAAILAGFVQQHPGVLQHHDIGLEAEENYGVNVGPNEALRALVNLSLYHSWHDPDDRRWEDAFDRNLRSEQPDSKPQDVAEDQQPGLDPPAVREWPWQR
jgi:glutamate transport system substrate-binding protein